MPYVDRSEKKNIINVYKCKQSKEQEFLEEDNPELLEFNQNRRDKRKHEDLIRERIHQKAREDAISDLKKEGKLPVDY